MSLEAGGGIPYRSNPAATLLVILTNALRVTNNLFTYVRTTTTLSFDLTELLAERYTKVLLSILCLWHARVVFKRLIFHLRIFFLVLFIDCFSTTIPYLWWNKVVLSWAGSEHNNVYIVVCISIFCYHLWWIKMFTWAVDHASDHVFCRLILKIGMPQNKAACFFDSRCSMRDVMSGMSIVC